MLYFGCWERPGHYLWASRNLWADESILPAAIHPRRLDGTFAVDRIWLAPASASGTTEPTEP